MVAEPETRSVRRMRERFQEGPLIKLSARVRDGRAHGTDYVVIYRVR